MKDVVRLAFIGLGPMGTDLLRAAVAHPAADVTALCDGSPEALASAKSIANEKPATFSDYRTMLHDAKLDAVVVAVPQHLHAQVTIDCLQHGLTTFCEKPMGLSVNQCMSMIAAAKSVGKGLMIGQVLRYIGPYRFILERIASGDLGVPLVMRTTRTMGNWGSWARPWRLQRETSGGLLLEVNVHELDLMLQILGPASSVTAIDRRFPNSEVDFSDFITAQIEFQNGSIGTITSSCGDQLGRHSGEVFLTNGTIYYESLLDQVLIGQSGKEREVFPYAEIHPEWENGVAREMREFIEACLGQREISIPGEDGLRAVELAQAAYQSAAEKRTVHLPLHLPLPA
ncbi:MAG: Gfo/Idh/MocA family oxidoreductase [Candidatus Hydrogenedentes bacterium]|nr:Gfo/Idh/MocA family oxidoreductase [Candidatus Hydrogenedentota bacterium]